MSVSETNAARAARLSRAAIAALGIGVALLLLFGQQAASAQVEPHDIWTDEGEVLTNPALTHVNGEVSLSAGQGSISCGVNSDVNLSFNGTGNVHGFFSGCSGTGFYAGCEITTTDGSLSQPWSLQAEADETVRVSDASWKWKFANCGYSATWEASTDIVLDPDNAAAISEYYVESDAVVLSSKGVPYGEIGPISGPVEVAEADVGRYGMAAARGGEYPGLWISEGAQLGETQEVEFDGRASIFSAEEYGLEYECAAHGVAALGSGGQGEFISFEYDPNDCTGSGTIAGGSLSNCTISDPEVPPALPLEALATQMVAWEFSSAAKWSGAECPLAGLVTTTNTELYFVVDDLNAIASVALSGEGTAWYSSPGGTPSSLGEAQISGEMDVTPSGLFGLAPAY